MTTQKRASHNFRSSIGRSLAWQVALLAIIVLFGGWLVHNLSANIKARNLQTGFGFLGHMAGIDISESIISYSPSDTYGRILAAGLANTIKVAIISIVAATILGLFFGVARLSRNWLARTLATWYVETMRNIPLLLQLFFWYALFTTMLPSVRAAFNPISGVFLSNRGLSLPAPIIESGHILGLVGLLVAIVIVISLNARARRIFNQTGDQPKTFGIAIALMIGLPVGGWLLGGAPTAIDTPHLKGFNIQGGIGLSPEFLSLFLGLTLYTGAFIAETVRGGILAVSPGQTEAAMALGLTRGLRMRLILLPQALRSIIPPLTSQYLNLTKNSSLAVAIGYPDLVNVTNTIINETGQSLENVAIILAAYLTLSLTIVALINVYDQRIAKRGGR